MTNINSQFSLLKSKKIIDILDGDTKFQEIKLDDSKAIKMSMPYLSGKKLCELSTLFGFPVKYDFKGITLSRWQYLYNLIEYCIQNDKCPKLLSHMFSKKQFAGMLSGHAADVIEKAQKRIVAEVIQQINGLLYFGENELIVNGNLFMIRKIGSKVEVTVPIIETIDIDYIKTISSRAIQEVDQGNYDSAITKARTLLEEIFCYVIEKKGETLLARGSIAKLYKQVGKLYKMHTDKETDRRINTLLSGLNNIVSSIAEMRNKASDAHGVGSNRIAISEHHARLIVNASMTLADFILSVANVQE